MRYNEIKNLMEAEPVPKLSSLWRYGDDFTPEQNEAARRAAMREIEAIRARNKQAAEQRRGARSGFQTQSFSSFGIDLHAYMQDYAASMYEFLVANPRYAPEYIDSMDGVTKDNVIDALLQQAGSMLDVLREALVNPGPDVETKYASQLEKFNAYRRTIRSLGPKGQEKANAALYAEMMAAWE